MKLHPLNLKSRLFLENYCVSWFCGSFSVEIKNTEQENKHASIS